MALYYEANRKGLVNSPGEWVQKMIEGCKENLALSNTPNSGSDKQEAITELQRLMDEADASGYIPYDGATMLKNFCSKHGLPCP